MTLVIGPKNHLKRWRKKRSHSKTAQVRQKNFPWLYVLRYSFIPT